ncbi:MAG: hypothetical protein JXI43_09775 [Tissierellales bacterium]|nr:hypothetical protein [Tissierellales bacterium]
MRQLSIHIGTNKTGTTSIQQTLYHSSQYLLSQRILYDTSLHPNNHHIAPIFSAMQYSKYNKHGVLDMSVEDMEKRFITSFSRNDFDHYIISSEFLLNKTDDDLKRLHAVVSPFFEDIKIIVYVREPIAYCTSQVQQRMKAIRREAFGIREEIKTFKEHIQYNHIRRWADMFGRSNLVLRRFDKKFLFNGDVVEDFFSLIDTTDIEFNRLSIKHSNFSLGKNSVLFLEQLNKKYPTFINGEINPLKGFAFKGLPIHIFRQLNDEKFLLDIKFNDDEANRMNEELRYINTYLSEKEHFDEVEATDIETTIPSIDEVPIAYLVDLFNQYNVFLAEKLDECDHLKNSNQVKLQEIHRLKITRQ